MCGYAGTVPDDLPLLDLAGLDALSESIYLDVLGSGVTSVARVAHGFHLSDPDATARLEALRDLGLVSLLQGDAREYASVDPRYALRAMADRISDRVSRIRERIPSLVEFYGRAPQPAGDEAHTIVLADPDAVAGWYTRLQHQAKTEFLAFDRPPYVSASLDPFEAVVLERGVDWRAVYTIASFDDGATWAEVTALAEQGEQSRITRDLPVKLAIADSTTALVSLSLEPGRIEALVTHAPALVEALRQLFEFHWARAMPLPAARQRFEGAGADAWGPADDERRAATSEERALLALFAVGMKDDAIARQLGISPRTLRRRSQDLLVELGASNRFQAGAEAAIRGWL